MSPGPNTNQPSGTTPIDDLVHVIPGAGRRITVVMTEQTPSRAPLAIVLYVFSLFWVGVPGLMIFGIINSWADSEADIAQQPDPEGKVLLFRVMMSLMIGLAALVGSGGVKLFLTSLFAHLGRPALRLSPQGVRVGYRLGPFMVSKRLKAATPAEIVVGNHDDVDSSGAIVPRNFYTLRLRTDRGRYSGKCVDMGAARRPDDARRMARRVAELIARHGPARSPLPVRDLLAPDDAPPSN